MLHLLPGLQCSGTPFFGVAGALFEQFVAPPLVLVKSEEVFEQFGEQAGIFGKIIEKALDDTLHPQVQAVTHTVAATFPADCRASDLVEQPAGRVAGTTEQPLVQQGHFKQRNVQTPDQRTQAGRQVVVVLDEGEQQANQVDHVLVGNIDTPACAAAHADPQQQLFKLLAKFEIVGLVGSGHIVLQMRKQAQQVGGADWLGGGHRLQTRRELSTHRGQQCLQRGKESLPCRVRAHLVTQVRRPTTCAHAPIFGTPTWCRRQFRQYTGGGQQLVGFAIDHVGIAQHIALEQFEQDQLDPQANPQVAASVEEVAAQRCGPQRVVLLVQGAVEQYLQAQAQLLQGNTVA